jgi:hypothetical protein
MSAGRRTRQLIKFMSELESLKEELRAIGQGRPRAAFEYGFVYSLAKWWREITRHLPSGSRGTSLLGQMFSNFVEAARKDAQIPGAASLNSAIKVVVRAMKGRRSSRQKTTV